MAEGLDEARIQSLMWLVRWFLRDRFPGADDWEELLSEAYHGMWRSLLAVQESGACSLSTAATRGAAWAAREYLRSNRNLSRRRTRRGVPIPHFRSLETIIAAEAGETGETNRSASVSFSWSHIASDEDLEAEAVERLAAADVVRDLAPHLRLAPEVWECVRRVVMEGESILQVARDLGASPAAVKARAAAGLRTLKAFLEEEQDDRL